MPQGSTAESDLDLIRQGAAHQSAGRLVEADRLYRQVLSRSPDQPDALHLLGQVAVSTGNHGPARKLVERAIAVAPDVPHYHLTLGTICFDQLRLTDAVAAFDRAIELAPDLHVAYLNHAAALRESGRVDEAIASFHRAVEIDPLHPGGWHGLLNTLYYRDGYDPLVILAAHQRWAEQFADPLTALAEPHRNDTNPDRPLRIGYISPELRDRALGRFMRPILAAHDRRNVEVICYSDSAIIDPITRELQAAVDVWNIVPHLSDEELADRIRTDRIDILVDLTLHGGSNRLAVFARKPAPIQVSYLGYPGTTGMRAMDYRLTDNFLDPTGNVAVAGESDAMYTEQSIRLPGSYWCYEPHEHAPQESPLPTRRNGFITFGCLGNFTKVSAPTVEAWAKILSNVPNSRLVVHAIEDQHLDRVRDALRDAGIDASRLQHRPRQHPRDYFATLQTFDIALDPFPCHGVTTSCDALWMGVPIITLAGSLAVHRTGVSLLGNLGLHDLVAQTSADYVRIATDLANSPSRIELLRETLRQRMKASPLMKVAQFTKDLESAYRQMWQRWREK